MEKIHIATDKVDEEALNSLAKRIGALAVEAFKKSDVREQFEEWKKREGMKK